jgi:GT2 family glycosyltransferase
MPAPPPPRLSIVIPTYDTRALTLACLRSIERERSDVDVEVLVVDDGSTDGTTAALREAFPTATVLPTAGGLGFTRAVNLGLRSARGEVLLLLNSDTELTAGGLLRLSEAFAEAPHLGIAGGRLVYPDGRAQWSGGARPDTLWLFTLASGLSNPLRFLPGYRWLRRSRNAGTVDWVSGAALALRREVWEAVGPFDEEFRFYAQDLDFCLRVREAGWTVAVVPSFRVVHHHGSTIRHRDGAADLLYQPPILWSDLVLWARKQGGPTHERRVARALSWGTRLRLWARVVGAPFAKDRRRWRAESDAYRAALRQLKG